MILAGELYRKISIRRASLAANAFNEQVATWVVIAEVRAKVTPVQDGERLRAGETLASRMSRFIVRWSKLTRTIDPTDRVMFEGREYDINGVKEIGRREGIEITATARAEAP
jgi:SPP1 family predicted phage head-tail adaptor